MPSALEPLEGIQSIQKQDTSVWGIDVANVASAPTSPTLHQVVSEAAVSTDIKGTVMPTGSISVSGTIIRFPAWAALSSYVGKVLRVEYSFLDNNNNRRARHIRFKVVL
jgi:hypothetical protein